MIVLRPINGADPMLEWCFLFSSRTRLADLVFRQLSAPIVVKRREVPKFDLPSDLEGGWVDKLYNISKTVFICL